MDMADTDLAIMAHVTVTATAQACSFTPARATTVDMADVVNWTAVKTIAHVLPAASFMLAAFVFCPSAAFHFYGENYCPTWLFSLRSQGGFYDFDIFFNLSAIIGDPTEAKSILLSRVICASCKNT